MESKENLNNIPVISAKMLSDFVFAAPTPTLDFQKDSKQTKIQVDVVQVAKIWDLKAIVYDNDTDAIRISTKIDETNEAILGSSCEQCQQEDHCKHVRSFINWLHVKNSGTKLSAAEDSVAEVSEESVIKDTPNENDKVASDDTNSRDNPETASLADSEGLSVCKAVLKELDAIDEKEAPPVQDFNKGVGEFEATFVHYALLDAVCYKIKGIWSFLKHMRKQAERGLFERLTDVTRINRQTPLWVEAQYMRLGCSSIHHIATRQDFYNDGKILQKIFTKGSKIDPKVVNMSKNNKRYILDQIEKITNKSYRAGGLILNEIYPYIYATPDGITDDHLVEIKIAHTERELQQYLKNGAIPPKYMSQLQIQMFMTNMAKALYCVVGPNFSKNGELLFVWVLGDIELLETLLDATEQFWTKVVFPHLHNIYLKAVE